METLNQLLLSRVLLCGLLLHTVSHQALGTGGTVRTKPNFIIVLADDIGWGDLDVNQPEKKANNTPNLNLMAQQGLR